MKIAVDLDEILSNSTLEFLNFYKNNYGEDFLLEQITDYSYDAINFSKEPHHLVMTKFHNSQEFEDMSVVAGAKEAIELLTKEHELFVVSGRPESLRGKTIQWLNENFSNCFKDVFITNTYSFEKNHKHVTKSSFCLDHGVTLLIDDQLYFAEECAKNGIKVLLFDYPWNRKDGLDDNITRVFSWSEIVEKIVI